MAKPLLLLIAMPRSRTTVQSLTKTLITSDFGIFVFAPCDTVRLRKKTYAAVRDNVLFELGLFVGRLGVERTFIVVPRNSIDLRIPTDLIGVTPGDYDAQRDAENLTAALGPVCNRIRRAMKETVADGRSWSPMVSGPALRNVMTTENRERIVRRPATK